MLSVCSHHLGEIGLLLLLWESAVLTHLVCLHKGQYLDAISNWIEFANGALRSAALLGFFQMRPFLKFNIFQLTY